MNVDERDLLAAVFEGEEGAFARLLERYRALIYSVFAAPGLDFPRDFHDDLFQSFVVALRGADYRKLRAFEGRNDCSLATFLQVVATRFALDERRKFRRQPRGWGEAGREDDEPVREPEDKAAVPVDAASLDKEQQDIFHNLLFSLDWKRISAVLWVFRDVQRERIAEVMSTSRANIDALYKRAKDQMSTLYADGAYSRLPRLPDTDVLTPAVTAALKELLSVPPGSLQDALLQPGAKRRALLGLVLVLYPRFLCNRRELARLAKVPEEALEAECLSVLREAAVRARSGSPS
jgi:DNA-directed RNA polymerase specialized sigma24 family protein